MAALTGESGAPLRVLVTGGAGGIGQVIAEHFAAAGARVMVCDVATARMAALEAERSPLRAVEADVGDADSVARLFAVVQSEFGGLDVLVNNAAITGPFGPVEDQSAADWARTITINLVGQFHCAQKATPMLRAAGGGSIVNISSVAGRLGYPLRTAYASSKWGVIGLTKSLAMELGPDNIRVNAILPGIVAGERLTRTQKAQADRLGVSHEEIDRRYTANISLRRKVPADEVAELAVFVCSPLGRSITGQSLGVCGNVETMRR